MTTRFNREPDMRNEYRPTVPHSQLEADVISLHEHYTARTGFDITLTLDRQRMWREWIAFRTPPFTREDLSLVITYFKTHIARGERNEGALKFLNLIGKVDQFEEDLALARKWRRPAQAPRRGDLEKRSGGETSPDERTPEERSRSFREAVTAPATNP